MKNLLEAISYTYNTTPSFASKLLEQAAKINQATTTLDEQKEVRFLEVPQ